MVLKSHKTDLNSNGEYIIVNENSMHNCRPILWMYSEKQWEISCI